MTFKNTKTIIAVIPILFVLAVALNIPEADAAQCTGATEHCYGKNNYDETRKGLQYQVKVTNLVPISSCSDIPTATGWVVFANNDWVENGFTSGKIDTTCNTDERSYIAYRDFSGFHEIRGSTLSIGTFYTFSLDDIDQNKYWKLKRGSSQLANLYMAYLTSNDMQVGIEGNRDNPPSTWIPETEFRNVNTYNTSWAAAPDVGSTEDSAKGYYHDWCTVAEEDFNAGTTSGVNC